jgi:hypothetical protein
VKSTDTESDIHFNAGEENDYDDNANDEAKHQS